jgi:hypothetical protein
LRRQGSFGWRFIPLIDAKMQREVDEFLATGEHDLLYRNWPGANFFDRAECGAKRFQDALIAVVRKKTSKVNPPELRESVPSDMRTFTRAKVAPMVRGLFRRNECHTVLTLLENAVVFILPETVEALIHSEDLNTAWKVANMYLQAIGVEPTSDHAPNVVGMSVETKCYVSHQYFIDTDPFADYVIHETAHIFHNVKRDPIGLRGTRYRPWLLPIRFQKRETFAYACEVYSRILERSEKPKDRLLLLEEAKRSFQPPTDMVDDDELFAILSDAVARRNGWKAILEACSEKSARRSIRRSEA